MAVREVVRAPAQLLASSELLPSARLIWLVAWHRDDWSPATVERYSGLARSTVLRGLALLKASGWLGSSTRAGRKAEVPGALLTDQRLGINARLLYGVVQLAGSAFTYAELSTMAGMSINTVKRGIAELTKAGWLQITQQHKFAPVHVQTASPQVPRAKAEVELARQRVEEAPYRGEALMREYLSLLIDSDLFEDNASPGFLVNPFTEERMEFDRFYPPALAFEFNGPQHYGPTQRYPNAAQQRGRDYIKLGICTERGIQLTTIHPEDLSLKGMTAKLDNHLPQRDLTGRHELIRFLEAASRSYRRDAQAWSHQNSKTPC